MTKQTRQLLARLEKLPAGLWIAALTLALVGGRYAWICGNRPAHGREIAAAFGSVGVFYGAPQVDSAGKRLTFAETGDKGYAVFLADVSAGRKSTVYEEPATGAMLDENDLHVWPWAPDDSAFIYSAGARLNICDSKLGKSVVQISARTNLAALAWLSPRAFACLGTDGTLFEFNKGADGSWSRTPLANKMEGVLRSVGGTSSASSEVPGAEAGKAFDQDDATLWSSGRAALPVWVQYQFRGPAWAVSQYKLTSSAVDPNADPRDWQLLASNDGTNWTMLDSRTNQAFASRGEARGFAVANRIPYWFYRLNITATEGRADAGVYVGEFQLWSDDTMEVSSASAQASATENAARAFDGDVTTKWFTGNGHPTAWLQYQYGGGAGRAVSRYVLTSGNDMPGRDPKDWQLLASNDGSKWTVLDRRSEESFDSRRQAKSYDFSNNVPYRFYRLSITAGQRGQENSLQLSDLALISPDMLHPAAGRPMSSPAVGWRSLLNCSSFTALSSNTVAWAQRKSLWNMDLRSGLPDMVLDLQEPGMPNLSITGFSYSKATREYLLSCAQTGGNSLWRFLPGESGSGLHSMSATGTVRNAAWLNGSDGGWVAQQGDHLLARQNGFSTPKSLMPKARIDALAVSPDGQRVFALGTSGREPSPGIWQCDIATGQFQSVIPNCDFPSPYAERIEPVVGSILTGSGKYNVYLPPDIFKHPRRKYPLVIGDTMMGVAVNGVHGRLWIPSAATCGAIVVIVNRNDWFRGLDRWGDEVVAAYNDLSKYLPFDKDRLFLFGLSAETTYLSQFVTHSPVRWAGVILFNPSGLPDFSHVPASQPRPRFFVNAGSLERDDNLLKQFQRSALKSGVLVEYVISPGEALHFVGNAGQFDRAKGTEHFIFEE